VTKVIDVLRKGSPGLLHKVYVVRFVKEDED